MATVAASAASVTSAGVVAAHAEDAKVTDPSVIDSRVKIAFEGAFFQNNVHSDDKTGGSDKLGNSNGDFSGSIALTKQISSDMDWRLAGAFHLGKNRSFDRSGPTTGFGNPGTLTIGYGDDYSFQAFDFDVGKHVKVQAADIRFFGGLRLVHSDETGVVSESFAPDNPTDKGGSADKVGSSEYWGIGPRVGAEAYYPLSETWGLTGAVSGSVMWGRRNDRVGVNVTSTNPDNHASVTLFSQSSSQTVTNLDASAGLSWTPLAGATFTAGYKVEQWHNLLINADSTTQTFHGPFLRLEVKM
ncbi:Lpg1974 family pore-forming outer membrane protein [Mesorhizobium loti]|uniref:Lpg1974 family pore-forming outer membrane protein n=1 Tax=Rhizobium loti TaxID=381 RepID=UPI000409322C|nr:Lpg1974 family pore-forming outer membrane protein [Mesorhizobium loti]